MFRLLHKFGIQHLISMNFDDHFPAVGAETNVFVNANDYHGMAFSPCTHCTHCILVIHFWKWSHPRRLQPCVVHALGAMMTEVDTSSLKLYTIYVA